MYDNSELPFLIHFSAVCITTTSFTYNIVGGDCMLAWIILLYQKFKT